MQFRSPSESNPQIRLYHSTLINVIYRADDELMVAQNAYGIAVGRAPVLHLNQFDSADPIAVYRENFEHIWEQAEPTAFPER